MDSEIYELLALLMRYVFLFLMVVFNVLLFYTIIRNTVSKTKEKQEFPDAGMVGFLYDPETDTEYPMPREGSIGGKRRNDIVIPELKKIEILFFFLPGQGIVFYPPHNAIMTVNGKTVKQKASAGHGAEIGIGSRTLLLRIYAGLDAPIENAEEELFDDQTEYEYFDAYAKKQTENESTR